MTLPVVLLSCVDAHPGFSLQVHWSRAHLLLRDVGFLLIQPEIRAQYVFMELLVIYEVKYIKCNGNLVANWNSLCVEVRENFLFSYCMSAALDTRFSANCVVCDSQRATGFLLMAVLETICLGSRFC